MQSLNSCPVCGGLAYTVCCYRPKNEFYVECSSCQLRTNLDKSKNRIIKFWNALPRNLRWTKEKPTQGWYWMRKKITLEIVYVQCALYVAGRIGGRLLTDEYFEDAEWAGPIQEPLEK